VLYLTIKSPKLLKIYYLQSGLDERPGARSVKENEGKTNLRRVHADPLS
jgi:hypothetical protein